MIRKIIKSAAWMYIILFTIVGLFTSFFADRDSINKTEILMMPPNWSGSNRIEITNPYSEPFLIHKLEIGDIELFKDTLLDPEKSIVETFSGDQLDISSVSITIRLWGEGVQESLRIRINNRDFVFLLSFHGEFYSLVCPETEDQITSLSQSNLTKRSFMGTDRLGRSIWVRLVYGTRTIFLICLISLILSSIIGILIGLIHGYCEGFVKWLLDGLTSLFSSLPSYLVVMLFVGVFGRRDFSFWHMVLAISLVQWVEIEKIICEEVQKYKRNDFIRGAKLFGRSVMKVLFSDILTLCIPNLVVGSLYFVKPK